MDEYVISKTEMQAHAFQLLIDMSDDTEINFTSEDITSTLISYANFIESFFGGENNNGKQENV